MHVRWPACFMQGSAAQMPAGAPEGDGAKFHLNGRCWVGSLEIHGLCKPDSGLSSGYLIYLDTAYSNSAQHDCKARSGVPDTSAAGADVQGSHVNQPQPTLPHYTAPSLRSSSILCCSIRRDVRSKRDSDQGQRHVISKLTRHPRHDFAARGTVVSNEPYYQICTKLDVSSVLDLFRCHRK